MKPQPYSKIMQRKKAKNGTHKNHFYHDYQIAPVDPRIFGGFLEHIGRAVYEGVYEPQSEQADEYGFRKDVLESLKRLSFTAMRYPGGNFASGYHWLDGVGPRATRPTIRELASLSIEPNQFRNRRIHPTGPDNELAAYDHRKPGYRNAGRSPQLGGILQQPNRDKICQPASWKWCC